MFLFVLNESKVNISVCVSLVSIPVTGVIIFEGFVEEASGMYCLGFFSLYLLLL